MAVCFLLLLSVDNEEIYQKVVVPSLGTIFMHFMPCRCIKDELHPEAVKAIFVRYSNSLLYILAQCFATNCCSTVLKKRNNAILYQAMAIL